MSLCEICSEKFKVINKHHIQSKRYGGSNSSNNIAVICSSCHDKVHIGDIIIEGRFSTGKGEVLIHRNELEDSITGVKDPQVHIYGS